LKVATNKYLIGASGQLHWIGGRYELYAICFVFRLDDPTTR